MLRSYFFLFCLLCLNTDSIFADNDISKHTNQNEITLEYWSIDDWVDVPLFSLGARVLVWEDGRIAWRDVHSLRYYKAQISTREIQKAHKFLLNEYKKHKCTAGNQQITCVYFPLLNSPCLTSHIASSKLLKIDLWDSFLIRRYEKMSKDFQVSEATNFIAAMQKFSNFSNIENDFDFSFLFSYNKSSGKDMQHPHFTNGDIYCIGQKFSADATFFLLLEKTVNSLTPKNEIGPPQDVKLARHRCTVKSEVCVNGDCLLYLSIALPENAGHNAETGAKMSGETDYSHCKNDESLK